MKKNYLLLASIMATGMFFTACSDELVPTDEPSVEQMSVTKIDNEVKLLDEKGNQVSSVSGQMGTYYIDITSGEEWTIKSNDSYIVPLVKNGRGCAKVPVVVGLNWQEARNGSLSVSFGSNESDGANARRKAGTNASDISLAINQAQTYSLAEVKKRIGSNLGAGFTYSPTTQFVLGTNVELFNIAYLDTLQSVNKSTYIVDDLYPRVEEEVHFGSSQKEIDRSVSVGVSVGIDFSKVSGDLDVDVNTNKHESTNKSYALKRMKSYQFTREINYLNIISDSAKSDLILSSGFKMIRNQLTKNIHTVTKASLGDKYTGTLVDYKKLTEEAKTDINELCNYFVDSYGPAFISKAVMGCVLDYRIDVDSTFLSDSVSVDVVLKLKYQSAVKPDSLNNITNADSIANDSTLANGKNKVKAFVMAKAEEKKDTTKVNGEVNVNVKTATTEAVSNTNAYVTVSGGDVSKVSILTTGGSLKDSDVIAWQQSVEPNKAVMIDYRLVPINVLFTDQLAQKCLYEYLKTKGSVIDEKAAQGK